MAKMLKHLVFGQKKNPPAPPRPDYEGEALPFENPTDLPFFDHNYENLPKFQCKGGQVRFEEKEENKLDGGVVLLDNYSEPLDLMRPVDQPTGDEDEDAIYICPVDDRGGTAPPEADDEEDVYCLPYDAPTDAPPLPMPALPQQSNRRDVSESVCDDEDDLYDVVPDNVEDDDDNNGDETTSAPRDEYDEPWEWSVGARLTSSLQVLSPEPPLEGDTEEEMTARQQRRLLYETAFDSRARREDDELDIRLGAAESSPPIVGRAASRSSFGSSTSGSSASSTPTRQPVHRRQQQRRVTLMNHHQQKNQSRTATTTAPCCIVNQNFERRISLWEDQRPQSTSPPKKDVTPPTKAARAKSFDLELESKPEATQQQSPETDARSSEDYDPPWDLVVNKKVNSSASVPEKLSGAIGHPRSSSKLTTSVTHEQLLEEPTNGTKASLSLNLGAKKSGGGMRPNLSLNFGCAALSTVGEKVDPQLTLEKQGWYHGSISRVDAEGKLRVLKEGSYLVRNSESSKHDYSLSLKSARGFMHMKIVPTSGGRFILGQFSNPFASIPEMIQHYSVNKLPIKGAEHMSLLYPVIDQLL